MQLELPPWRLLSVFIWLNYIIHVVDLFNAWTLLAFIGFLSLFLCAPYTDRTLIHVTFIVTAHRFPHSYLLCTCVLAFFLRYDEPRTWLHWILTLFVRNRELQVGNFTSLDFFGNFLQRMVQRLLRCGSCLLGIGKFPVMDRQGSLERILVLRGRSPRW